MTQYSAPTLRLQRISMPTDIFAPASSGARPLEYPAHECCDTISYGQRTLRPCGSARSTPSTTRVIGATPTSAPRHPSGSTRITPTPGVLPTALLTQGRSW